jgi:ribosome-associated protein
MPKKTSKRKPKKDLALVKLLCRALDDKKAEDLVVLDVSKMSSITNYLVIASGNSEPHLRALSNEVDAVLKESGTEIVGVDARAGSGWAVVDAFDVMVHLLTAENRDRYKLEILWGDAPRIDIVALLPAVAAAR